MCAESRLFLEQLLFPEFRPHFPQFYAIYSSHWWQTGTALWWFEGGRLRSQFKFCHSSSTFHYIFSNLKETLSSGHDLYRSLWTAVKRLYFWIWFILTLRVLLGQPTPHQAFKWTLLGNFSRGMSVSHWSEPSNPLILFTNSTRYCFPMCLCIWINNYLLLKNNILETWHDIICCWLKT